MNRLKWWVLVNWWSISLHMHKLTWPKASFQGIYSYLTAESKCLVSRGNGKGVRGIEDSYLASHWFVCHKWYTLLVCPSLWIEQISADLLPPNSQLLSFTFSVLAELKERLGTPAWFSQPSNDNTVSNAVSLSLKHIF